MEKLGIEPTLLIAQIVNFLIIMVVLTKLLYKPILTMLEKRKKEIEEGLKITERMRQEDEKLQIKRQKMLETTRGEAQSILEEARKQAKEEEKDIIAQAHKEAEQIIVKAKSETDHIREEMEKGVRESAVELAVAMTKRLLSSSLGPSDKHKLIDRHIKELSSVKVK